MCLSISFENLALTLEFCIYYTNLIALWTILMISMRIFQTISILFEFELRGITLILFNNSLLRTSLGLSGSYTGHKFCCSGLILMYVPLLLAHTVNGYAGIVPLKPHILLDHCGLPSLLPPHSGDTASSTPSYALSLHSGWSVALTLSIWQWKAPAQMKSHLFTISGIDWASLITYRTKYKSHSHLKPPIMLFWPIEEYSHQTRGFALPQMRQYFPTLRSWLMLFFCLECLAPSHLQPLKYYPTFNVHHKWYPLHKSFLDIFNWMPASLSQPYTFHAHLLLLLTL